MNNKYFYIFVLFLFIYIFYPKILNSENFINLDNFININNQDIKKQVIPIISELGKDKKLEILDLPFCSIDFLAHYSPNSNNIINNGSKIYQDMLKSNEQRSQINDKDYNLVQVSWVKSLFTFNGKPVGLEMQFIHIDLTNGNIIKIIFPLSFTPSKKNRENILGNTSINNFMSLLLSEKDVPIRKVGQINIGNLLHLDLCGPSKLIFNQKKFFMAKTINGELILIAKPQLFSRIIGTTIMNNLDDPI